MLMSIYRRPVQNSSVTEGSPSDGHSGLGSAVSVEIIMVKGNMNKLNTGNQWFQLTFLQNCFLLLPPGRLSLNYTFFLHLLSVRAPSATLSGSGWGVGWQQKPAEPG